MIEKIQIYISIVAALAITVAAIISRATLYDFAVRLITVIVVFYFIGIIVKHYLVKNVFIPEQEEPLGDMAEAVMEGDTLPNEENNTASGEPGN